VTLEVPTMRQDEALLNAVIDDARTAMQGEMQVVKDRAKTYLNWYSPPFDTRLRRHDQWEEAIDWNEDAGTTRNTFNISRAVVDIWTSLEAAKPPIPRAEPESVAPPPPELDQGKAMIQREIYAMDRTIEGRKSDIRSRRLRQWLRKDNFGLKQHTAVRRKNLYGFSWMKVVPDFVEMRPKTHVMRDPTNVYPIWSSRDPEDVEAILNVERENARLADAKYGLGLDLDSDGRVVFQRGYDHGHYSEVNDLYYDSTRTMVWIEDFWWVDRRFENDHLAESTVHHLVRVLGKIRRYESFPWRHVPFVYWENTDERDAYGWSDIANVIDINDELNRRLSEEGDIISMFSQPRFQLLGSMTERQVEMPGPLELLSLQDTERIEQILTRIDVWPAQQHVQQLTELLYQVSGLPPIVWGLISNAQTSGRALTASWKATETRLVPKMNRNQLSLDRMIQIFLDYGRNYDWRGSKEIFEDRYGETFDDIRWKFPPMEPRDFQEVTMDAITRRDAGLTTSVKAIRDTGDEDAEETWEEVKAENTDINAHPDKVQAFLLAQRAQLDNLQMAQQMGQPMPDQVTTGSVAQTIGQARQAAGTAQNGAPPGVEGPLPPTAPGAAANAGAPIPGQTAGSMPGAEGEMLTSGTLVRGGDVSNQFLQTRRMG
jgi:hypothetical protein